MTDEELKALVAENSLAIRESRQERERLSQDLRVSRQESEKRWEDLRVSRQESEKRWEDLRVSRQESEKRWQESRRETERLWQEIRDLRQESEKRWQKSHEEILASRRETDRLIRSLNQQLGRLGNKLGDYVESAIRPSLERALREQFGMTSIHSPMHLQRNGHALEIDVVGYAQDASKGVYLAEIYLATIKDDVFEIVPPDGFTPRAFGLRGA